MKKFLLALIFTMTFMVSSFAAETTVNNRFFGFSDTYVEYQGETHEAIVLVDGTRMIEVGVLDYVLIRDNGTTSQVNSPYRIHGQNQDGTFVVYTTEKVKTNEDDYLAGRSIEVNKYGLMNDQLKVIIQPIIDKGSAKTQPLTFDSNTPTLAEHYYNATEYSYGGSDIGWLPTPHTADIMVVAENYDVWYDIEDVVPAVKNYNRFVVNYKSEAYLVDSNLNTIARGYSKIEEIGEGRWYATLNTPQITSDNAYELDNYGNRVSNYDFDLDTDVEVSDWAKPYIEEASRLGIITGEITLAYDQDFFKQNISRFEFCRLVVNLLEAENYPLPTITDRTVFSDTTHDDVLIAHKLGIINGIGDGKFDPYSNLTREQAAKILVNIADLLVIDTTNVSPESKFSDIGSVSSWARDSVLRISAVQTLDGESVMGGTTASTFSPKMTYTVEQAVTTLVRLVNTARG